MADFLWQAEKMCSEELPLPWIVPVPLTSMASRMHATASSTPGQRVTLMRTRRKTDKTLHVFCANPVVYTRTLCEGQAQCCGEDRTACSPMVYGRSTDS